MRIINYTLLIIHCPDLTLYAAVCVAAGEGCHLVGRHEVEVAGHGVLQGRCSNGKFESVGLVVHGEKSMDETSGEAVAATYAVDYRIDVVALAYIEVLAIIYHGFPAIVGG